MSVAYDATTTFEEAVVIGLGLIGGSMARDLSASGTRVLAFDQDADAVRAAQECGLVADGFDPAAHTVPERALVVLAMPVDAIVAFLSEHAPRLGKAALIMDVGSTKREIVQCAERAGLGDRFIGAHPLAGDHRAGWAASRTGLFLAATVFLCSPRAATPQTVAAAERLWVALGARPRWIDAAAHDERLAWTSHMPQLAATALALTLAHADVERQDLGRGGADMTRLAASSVSMWTAIARQNSTHIAAALSALEGQLAILRDAIENGDGAVLRACFDGANRWSERQVRPGG